MWFHYLKLSFRSLMRRKLYTAINLFGLSVAMACAVVGYLNFEFNTGWDRFHAKKDRIYRLGSIRDINGQPQKYGIVPSPVVNVLKSDVPGIDQIVEWESYPGSVRIDNQLLSERLYFTGSVFFDVFSFTPRQGNPRSALSTRNEVVLSDEFAVKYFGTTDAVGRKLLVKIGDDSQREFTVGSVMHPIPKNSSVHFDVLLNHALLEELNLRNTTDWKDWTGSIFFETASNRAVEDVTAALQPTIASQNGSNPNIPVSGYFVSPLVKVAQESRNIRNNILRQNPPVSSFVGTLVMAGMIMLLACFNYINTSLAYAATRLKEVGVRKVVGGLRQQIVSQFLGEQLVLCALAMVLSLGLTELFLRGWNRLWSWNQLDLIYGSNVPLLLFLAALLLFVAVGAGFYPAYYVSRFRPSEILKGQTLHTRINGFMRVMLILQFTLSLQALIQVFSFMRNADYVREIDLGIAKDDRIMIPLADETKFGALRDALMADARIEAVASGKDHVFFGYRRRPVVLGDKKVETDVLSVADHYMSVMNFRLAQGRYFENGHLADQEHVVITKNLASALGLENPVGQSLEVENKRFTVIGVVDDFLNQGVWRVASPALFQYAPDQHGFVIVQAADGLAAKAFRFVQETWSKILPDIPFPGHFQDRMVAEAVQVSENIVMMNLYLGVLAITMTILGLFSLVSIKTVRRTKEIGIRKVLGATVVHIVGLMNKEFVIMIVIALVLGNGLGYWLTNLLLGSIYTYHAGMTWISLAVSDAILLCVALTTASWVVYRVACENPVQSLRYE